MKKTAAGNKGNELCSGRVLARILAEDLRKMNCGSGGSTVVVNTVTDLGDQYDLTYRGSDASY